MKNKTVANGLVASFIVTLSGTIIESYGIQTLGGLGLWLFGVWAAVKLYKLGE